ncbi:MAG: substrate-binding domain-containing protein [Bacillota bacterium]|nr:substrate-binding domain-containing protein [Bacillota bacterium]
MKRFKKGISLLLIVMLILAVGCSQAVDDPEEPDEESPAEEEELAEEAEDQIGGELILATTTSTENSGLLDYILPDFEEKTGVDVKVVAVGTGAALQKGMDGEADVLLVHAKAREEAFVAEGHGPARYDVMYNDFVIIGPEPDPAEVEGLNVVEALTKISEAQAPFVSRGDDSGTHTKERSLWEAAEITPEGDWYVEVGKGMGDTITMAEELQGYTMSDRATYLSMKDNLDSVILVEGDEILFNQYGVMQVDPGKNNQINEEAAEAFVNWIISEEAQELIGTYKAYGEVLFNPNAK